MEYVYDLEVTPDDMPKRRMKVEDIPIGIEIITPSPGGMELSVDLEKIIQQELEMTNEELAKARRELPTIEQRALKRLSEAHCPVLPKRGVLFSGIAHILVFYQFKQLRVTANQLFL